MTKYSIEESDDEAIKSDSDNDDFRPTEEAADFLPSDDGGADDANDSFELPKPTKKYVNK